MGLELKIDELYCPSCLHLTSFDYVGMRLSKEKGITYYYNCAKCKETLPKQSIYTFDAIWRKVVIHKGNECQ
jgi:uncharacterized Zn finger protein